MQLSSSFESCDEGSDKSSDQRYSSQGESSSDSRHSGKDSKTCDNVEPKLSTSHESKIHPGQTSPEASKGVVVETSSTEYNEPAPEPSSNLEIPETLENPLPHCDRAGVGEAMSWSAEVKGSCTVRVVGGFQESMENSMVDFPVLETPGQDLVDNLEKFDGEPSGRSSPQRKPENLSLHGAEVVRKPRKGTPVKVVSGPGEHPETVVAVESQCAQDMSFKGVRDRSTNESKDNPGQVLIKVPVFRCSSTTASTACDESFPQPSKDPAPLDLSNDRKKKPNSEPQEDLTGCGPFEDYTVQILVLNGKEYEIIPLGNGRWLSRNEYELLKGLGPGELVSHNPKATENHSPQVFSTTQKKKESNPILGIRDYGTVERGTTLVPSEERDPSPCDSKRRLELPDLVLAGKKPKLDLKYTAAIYGGRLFGDNSPRMEDATPSRSVFS